MLERIIGGFITILIGVSLVGPISNQVNFHKGLDIIGWTVEESEKKEPHRQTYLEYVKERLEVERLMR